jgi:hypothetical protein
MELVALGDKVTAQVAPGRGGPDLAECCLDLKPFSASRWYVDIQGASRVTNMKTMY